MNSTMAPPSTAPIEPELFPAPDVGWTLLGWAGAVLAIIGAVDLALVWYPMNWGNPAWEFGTVSASLDVMPVLTLGLGLLLGAGVARGRRGWIRTVAVVMIISGVTILLAGALYATTIPIALDSVSDPLVRLGVKKAILKALIQMLLYPAAFFWLAGKSWRHSTGRWPW